MCNALLLLSNYPNSVYYYIDQVIYISPCSVIQVFVNFAKEQSDDDQLTDVIVNNGTVQTVWTARPVQIAPPTIQPQQSIKPPQPSKTPQSGKSSDSKPKESKSKQGKPKEGKSRESKSKEGRANGETDSCMAMISMPQPEQKPQEKLQMSRGTSGGSSSTSSSAGVKDEARESTATGSKRNGESSSKDPTALFIVGSNTQDSNV